MISDYVAEGYDEEDQLEEHQFIARIIKDLSEYGIVMDFIEVKNLEELEVELKKYSKDKIIIFNWCEEVNAKSNSAWEVTKFLEDNGFVFSGADTRALEIAIDRKKIYEICSKEGANVPQMYTFDTPKEMISFPVIVKSLHEHGSFAITDKSILENYDQVLETKKNIDTNNFYMEQFINGREFTVTVWGNDDPEVLPIMEFIFESDKDKKYKIQDYDSKWKKDDPSYKGIYATYPETLPETEHRKIMSEAYRAYVAIKCCGFARMEVRVEEGVPYVIDINPNPNFRPGTSIMKSAAKSGYNEGMVVAKLCEYALDRWK